MDKTTETVVPKQFLSDKEITFSYKLVKVAQIDAFISAKGDRNVGRANVFSLTGLNSNSENRKIC